MWSRDSSTPSCESPALKVRRVCRHEGVSGMARGLGSLDTGDRVLDRVRVQSQFLGEPLEELVIGLAQVEPDECALLLQVVGDLLKGEVLSLEETLSPQPGADLVAGASAHGHSLHRQWLRVSGRRILASRRSPFGPNSETYSPFVPRRI